MKPTSTYTSGVSSLVNISSLMLESAHTEHRGWVDNRCSVFGDFLSINVNKARCSYCNGLIINPTNWSKKFTQIGKFVLSKYGFEFYEKWVKEVKKFLFNLEGEGVNFCPTCPADISNLIIKNLEGKRDKDIYELFYKPFEGLF